MIDSFIRYPTILFFPAKRKIESLSFPNNVPITTTSLIQFILANAQDIVKWKTSFQLCNRSCLIRNYFAYSSQNSKLFKKLKTNLNELSLLYEYIEKTKANFSKKKKSQLHQLNLFKQNLIDVIIEYRKKLKQLSILKDLIKLRIKNYDDKVFDSQQFENILPKNYHSNEKSKKENQTRKEKSFTSKQSNKKINSKVRKKDEL